MGKITKADNLPIEYDGQTKIAEWYMQRWPSDDWGYTGMNKNITFQNAYECLQVGFDFYTFLGVEDSVVRERVFDALATLMGCSYDHVYYQWLNHGKNPLGGALIGNMQGMRFENEEAKAE